MGLGCDALRPQGRDFLVARRLRCQDLHPAGFDGLALSRGIME
jgi:hypothetical protein